MVGSTCRSVSLGNEGEPCSECNEGEARKPSVDGNVMSAPEAANCVSARGGGETMSERSCNERCRCGTWRWEASRRSSNEGLRLCRRPCESALVVGRLLLMLVSLK